MPDRRLEDLRLLTHINTAFHCFPDSLVTNKLHPLKIMRSTLKLCFYCHRVKCLLNVEPRQKYHYKRVIRSQLFFRAKWRLLFIKKFRVHDLIVKQTVSTAQCAVVNKWRLLLLVYYSRRIHKKKVPTRKYGMKIFYGENI